MTEEELFAGAVALPREERAAFLRRECGEDETLRLRVEELLALDAVEVLFVDTLDEVSREESRAYLELGAPNLEGPSRDRRKPEG